MLSPRKPALSKPSLAWLVGISILSLTTLTAVATRPPHDLKLHQDRESSLTALEGSVTLSTLFEESPETRLLSESSSNSTTAEPPASDEHATASEESISHSDGESDEEEHETGGHENEPFQAALFPSFSVTIGLVAFFMLTRYASALPFTAVMFLIGTLMGIGVELLPDNDDHLSVSTRMWSNIDSEVLILLFLPGLIFKDSVGLDVHLFRTAFMQCIIFAFPMVLLGTILTAIVAVYIFPYGWGWNLAMTFGSILSATDPVAVAALLEEVGAPPRLKVHIGGEALLNDGSAIVFFNIFAARYFYQVGKEGFGEDVDWARGFELFFKMCLGGAAIGLCFGLSILYIFWLLDRRFSRHENGVEVVATAALAYIGYYVAEIVCHTSGVIATLAAGVTVKYFGRSLLNDAKLFDDFWVLVEFILNTILFTLGGAVWGSVIADGESHGYFVGRDWGYMIILYICLMLIRTLMFLMVYPLTSRIGLLTNLKETFFQIFGGLRGAVGIALAISLDNSMTSNADPDSEFVAQTRKAFGMIGGIAFCTLIINGTTAGPLLIKMGLADSTDTRKRIVEAFKAGLKQHMIAKFVQLLSEPRFRNVNFGLVKAHVPDIADLTTQQLLDAIERHKDTTASEEYQLPYLQGVLPYLESGESPGLESVKSEECEESLLQELAEAALKAEREKLASSRKRSRNRRSNLSALMFGEPFSAQEMRFLFISILRGMYEKQIDQGELVDREFLSIALQQSLELAGDAVANGAKLADWHYVLLAASDVFNRVNHSATMVKLVETVWGKGSHTEKVKKLIIERSMNFMAAHEAAQKYIRREFVNADRELSEAARLIIEESEEQSALAAAVLDTFERSEVECVTSHKFCTILLNSGAHYVSRLAENGLLKEDEAEHWVKEIEGHLQHVEACTVKDHPGELHVDYVSGEYQLGKGKVDDDRDKKDHAHNEEVESARPPK